MAGNSSKIDISRPLHTVRSGHLQLPLSSVVEEFKIAKCKVFMMYRDSQDEQVTGVTTRSENKWTADKSVAQAESMLRLCDIIGTPCTGGQGLESSHFQQWSHDPGGNSEPGGGGSRRTRAAELASQGAWTKWDLPKRKITWAVLWRLKHFASPSYCDQYMTHSQGQRTCTSVAWERTYCASWVPWHTSCQHSPKRGTDGVVTRCS